MTDRDRDRSSDKGLGERIEELWQDLLGALEHLVSPEPQLVPVPVRVRPPRPRRR